ncbi:MAG: amidohydrolase [Candidatus Sericytochromatia bacterium]|nr:amidohydrolase [Candidatus Sericytochromatia bacterium]
MPSPESYRSILPSDVSAKMVAIRRDLHRHPELAGHEVRTAAAVMAELQALGLNPRRVAGTGVVADLPGLSAGPLVALRADMDALPIHEETGLPFASETPGLMHACGHDGHTSMLLGAARLLSQGPPPPVGVRFLFQPAEEKATGALAMIEAGALADVGLIFGGHIDRRYRTGELVLNAGPMNACADLFTITIQGQGGHGARPHEAVDAVVVGSLLVASLQAIVARETDPADPCVVTIGSFHAGSAANVIAGTAVLTGTLRAQTQATRRHLQDAIERMAAAIGQMHRASLTVTYECGTPPLVNSPEMAALAHAAAADVVGAAQVVGLRTANMGGEDFAYFLDHVPGGFIRFGAQTDGETPFPAHSSRFDFNEAALDVGAAWFARIAILAGASLTAGGMFPSET